MADLGNLTTVVFGTTGFTASLLSISGPGISRPAIDVTNLATTVARVFVPSDLYDGGELEMTIQWDGTEAVPITGVAETITIAWGGTINTSSFSGFVTGLSAEVAEGEVMTATITVKVTGAVTL